MVFIELSFDILCDSMPPSYHKFAEKTSLTAQVYVTLIFHLISR